MRPIATVRRLEVSAWPCPSSLQVFNHVVCLGAARALLSNLGFMEAPAFVVLGEHDAVEQKQQLDAQLHEATADTAESMAVYNRVGQTWACRH